MQTLKFCFVSHNNISKLVYTQILFNRAHPNRDLPGCHCLGTPRSGQGCRPWSLRLGGQDKWAEKNQMFSSDAPQPTPLPMCQGFTLCSSAPTDSLSRSSGEGGPRGPFVLGACHGRCDRHCCQFKMIISGRVWTPQTAKTDSATGTGTAWLLKLDRNSFRTWPRAGSP